jgi:hypothetical protein
MVLPQWDDVRTRVEKIAKEIFGWWRYQDKTVEVFLK